MLPHGTSRSGLPEILRFHEQELYHLPDTARKLHHQFVSPTEM